MDGYIKELRKLIGNMPIVMCCAAVIVLDSERRVLLQQRTDNGCWGIPGGAIEPGEILHEAAAREAFEETGIEVINLSPFKVYSGPSQHHIYPNGDEAYIVDNVFITSDFKGAPMPDGDETRAVAFFSLDDLPGEIHHTNKPILEDLAYYCKNKKIT
ncbi:MAG TPA: NUDIX domain-containing protein [Clostridia bacterium]